MLIAQDKIRVEHFRRQGSQWLLTEVSDPTGIVDLTSIDCHIAMQEIYDKVEFPPESVPVPG